MPKYLCKNYGSCSKADAREEIELAPGVEPTCECGFKLDLMEEEKGGSRKYLVAGIASVAVVALAAAGWFSLGRSGADSSKAGTVAQGRSNDMARPGVVPNEQDLASRKRAIDESITAQGATAANPQKEVIAKEYIKAAVMLMREGKWQEADAQLLKAKNENPNEPLVYYNQAIVHLKQARSKEAIRHLEEALKKGFKDFPLLEADSDLNPLRKESEFKALVAQYKPK